MKARPPTEAKWMDKIPDDQLTTKRGCPCSSMLLASARMLQMKKTTTTTSSITARLWSFFSWLLSIARVAFARLRIQVDIAPQLLCQTIVLIWCNIFPFKEVVIYFEPHRGRMSFPDGQKNEKIEDSQRGEWDYEHEDEVHPGEVDAEVEGVFAQRGALDQSSVLAIVELRAVRKTCPQNLVLYFWI